MNHLRHARRSAGRAGRTVIACSRLCRLPRVVDDIRRGEQGASVIEGRIALPGPTRWRWVRRRSRTSARRGTSLSWEANTEPSGSSVRSCFTPSDRARTPLRVRVGGRRDAGRSAPHRHRPGPGWGARVSGRRGGRVLAGPGWSHRRRRRVLGKINAAGSVGGGAVGVRCVSFLGGRLRGWGPCRGRQRRAGRRWVPAAGGQRRPAR